MKQLQRLPALFVAALIACASTTALFLAPTDARAQAPAQPAAGAPTVPAEAPKAATPTPPPGAGEPMKEVIENPYGLEALWKQGDFVSKGTLIILVIMSMGSWYIMFVKV